MRDKVARVFPRFRQIFVLGPSNSHWSSDIFYSLELDVVISTSTSDETSANIVREYKPFVYPALR